MHGDASVVYVGRPSRWGNLFRIGKDGSRQQVIEKYLWWFVAPERAALRAAVRRQLRGKKLACFCAPHACHAEILAYYADGRPIPVKPKRRHHRRPAADGDRSPENTGDRRQKALSCPEEW
jgi:hypothetical protein